jgi:hypothetical protein
MSLDYGCHCRLTIPEAQRRIDFMRRTRPDLFRDVVHVTDAALGRFDVEIAREFGVDAQSKFSIHLLNNAWLDECREALEVAYQVFGTRDLVITYGNDSIRPPLQQYDPMVIG